MSDSWTRILAVVRLEWRVQRREPLSFLYLLVFGALAATFAAAGPLELVRGRGAVPRDSAWSLMLASTAITAVGQVITTMVAATVVLRDRADRVAELLVATRLSRREYLLGKLLAALSVLAVIYLAVPVGLVVGAVAGGGSLVGATVTVLVPYLCVVVPTMLSVGTLQFAAGVLSGRLWFIVGIGLIMLWIWSAAVDVVSGPHAVRWLALLDPFASAPVLFETRAWSDVERAVRPVPATELLALNRAIWMLFAIGVAAWAVSSSDAAAPPADASAARRPSPVDGAATMQTEHTPAVRRSVMRRAGPPQALRGASASAAHTRRWLLRDRGFQVLAVLGAINVGVHVVIDLRAVNDPTVAASLAALSLQQHSRLFLILLATIYAGELVWRERDDRSAAFFDAAPTPTWAQVLGRIGGTIVAQSAVVLLLAGTAVAAAVSSLGVRGAVIALGPASATRLLAPFVLWMMVSLAVQTVVQQKVVAHLLCIAAWVWAMVVAGWGDGAADGWAVQPVAAVVAGIAVAVVLAGWRRGEDRPGLVVRRG